MLSANSQKMIQCLQRSFHISSRSLAHAATAPSTDSLEDSDAVQISKLDNGIKVASCDHGGALSNIVIAAKAGSRFEGTSQIGLSHVIKNAAFISNGIRTTLSNVRGIQQLGCSVECSSSRELISRKGVVLRNHLAELFENLACGVSSPLFNRWDLEPVREQTKSDVAGLGCEAINFELLHEAAYRNGLGNSVYCNDLRVDNYSEADLHEFAKQFYVGERITIVGTNVDHDTLVQYSKELLGSLSSGSPAAVTQKYHGGDLRANTGNGLTYASLVAPAAGLCSTDLHAFAVLQRLLGDSTSIKWGSNTISSRLNRAAKGATKDPFIISSLNISYSDAGLLGFHAVSNPSAIGSVMQAAFKEIVGVSNGEISSEDVSRAKTQLKSKIFMLSEGCNDHVDDLVNQVALTGGYVTLSQTFQDIDAVSLEGVVEIAKQMLNSKATLAVTGDTSTAPYLDELL